jgi:hypothetical protein
MPARGRSRRPRTVRFKGLPGLETPYADVAALGDTVRPRGVMLGRVTGAAQRYQLGSDRHDEETNADSGEESPPVVHPGHDREHEAQAHESDCDSGKA